MELQIGFSDGRRYNIILSYVWQQKERKVAFNWFQKVLPETSWLLSRCDVDCFLSETDDDEDNSGLIYTRNERKGLPTQRRPSIWENPDFNEILTAAVA